MISHRQLLLDALLYNRVNQAGQNLYNNRANPHSKDLPRLANGEKMVSQRMLKFVTI